MPLPTFDTLDEIPEAFREEYEERETEGVKKWHPKEPDNSGLTSALTKERERAAQEERERKRLAKELTELKRTQEAGAAGITQETLDRWNAEKAAEIAAKEAEIEKRDKELRALKLDDQAKRAFLAAGGKPDRVAAAMKLSSGRYDLNDAGAVIVLDGEGKATGQSLTDFFAKAFRDEIPELYAPSGATGGGAGGGGGSGTNNSGNMIDAVLAKNTERASAPNALRPQAAGA